MSDENRGGGERPQEVVARARALADAGDNQAALQMLLDRRGDWGGVPPVYDAMLGRFLLRANEAESALDHLTRARDGYGEKMPVEQRRDLGVALLQVGRVEAAGRELALVERAGAKVARAAHRAAIEAYMKSATTEPDAGEPTTYRIMAQAQALFDAKKFDAARNLLQQNATDGQAQPVAYHAMLGQLLFRAGERLPAIGHLTLVRDANPDSMAAGARMALGTALFEVGRFADAGRELHLALAAGAPITRCDLLIAVNAHRSLHKGGAATNTTFAKNLTVLDPAKRVICVLVPKNAGKLLRTTFALNARDDAADGKQGSDMAGRNWPNIPAAELAKGGDYFRFVVLRDPWRRLLSAYLDKVVRERDNTEGYAWMQLSRTIRGTQKMLGIPYDPVRSISFEEFVRYVATVDDVACDMHWMPQARIAGLDLGVYDHVGTVERLDETLELLSSRFGYNLPDPGEGAGPGGHRNITHYSHLVKLSGAQALLPHELDAYEQRMPMPEFFYTKEMTQLVQKRYAADVALHAEATGRA